MIHTFDIGETEEKNLPVYHRMMYKSVIDNLKGNALIKYGYQL